MTDNSEQSKTDAPDLSGQPSNEAKERYKQQLEGKQKQVDAERERAEKNEWMLIDSELERSKSDNSHLLSLHERDPDLAEKVAQRFVWPSWEKIESFDQYRGFVETPKEDQQLTEDQIGKRVERLVEEKLASYNLQQTHQQALKTSDELFWNLDEEIRLAAKEKFNTITEGKTLTPKEATEYAEMATFHVSKDKMTASVKNANFMGMSATSLSWQPQPKQRNIVEWSEDLARRLWKSEEEIARLYPKN